MAQVHQFLTEVPRFPRFLEIRCQASAAAGLEKPPPSGDRWLRPVTRIVCCQVGARRPLRCEQPSSSSWPPSASCRRGQDWQLQGPCCGSVFFLRRRAAEEKNGLGQIARTTAITPTATRDSPLSKHPTSRLGCIALLVGIAFRLCIVPSMAIKRQ